MGAAIYLKEQRESRIIENQMINCERDYGSFSVS